VFLTPTTSLITDAHVENDEAEEMADSAPQNLQEIGIIELLEQDSRPTFVIDLQSPDTGTRGRMNVVFCNKSLRFFDDLRTIVCAETFFPAAHSPSSNASTESGSELTSTAAELNFKLWATSNVDDSTDGYLPRHTFRQMFWTCSTLRSRWRVVSASQVPNQKQQSHGTPKSSRSTPGSNKSSKNSLGDRSESGNFLANEANLSKQLADSESKFRVLTELNPVGIYYLNPEGHMKYANDMCKVFT
jgi:PAS domain-containing protein